MTAVLYCLLLGSVSAAFHNRAKTFNAEDTDRVIRAYNIAHDNCKQITGSSSQSNKLAANYWCDQAFSSLDDVKLNFCSGWRYAECRPVKGHSDYQCTCMTSKFEEFTRKKNAAVTHFRDCAPFLWNRDPTSERSPPAADLSRAQPGDEITLDTLDSRLSHYCGLEAGSSGKFKTSSGAGSSSRAHASTRFGSLKAAETVQGDEKKAFKCAICKVDCKDSDNLGQHMMTHEVKTKTGYTCALCNRQFQTRNAFNAHKKNAHEKGKE